MLGLVESALLFTRDGESVRLVRITRADGPSRLLVEGPGHAQIMHVVDSAIDCLWHQADIERRLVAEGFRPTPLANADRRSGRDRRAEVRGSDRRRPTFSVAS
jgi:hypothetical protein